MSNPKFVRNEVTYITNEIDYDKLAEAIVKAQRQEVIESNYEKIEEYKKKDELLAKPNEEESTQPENMKGRCLSVSLALVIAIIYILLGALAGIFLIVLLVYCIITLSHSPWDSLSAWMNNLEFIGVGILLSFIAILVIVMSIESAREVSKETDKHYIVSVFSAIVCFVALIVSLIALNKPADNIEVVAAINSLEQTICNEYAKYAEQDSEELEDFQREILDAIKALEEETNEQVA